MWYIYVMSDFLVIVPTRGRPNNIVELIQAWKVTDTKADLLIAVDDDDVELENYRMVFENNRADNILFHVDERLRLGGTLNKVAALYAEHYDIVGFMGDDHRPRTIHWDQKIAKAIEDMDYGIAYGNDLIWGEGLPTAAYMSARIVERIGYFVPPGMVHLYLDNFWMEFGQKLGKLKYLNDVVIEHMHFSVGKSEKDAGYVEVNAAEMYSHDLEVFNQYKVNQMDLDVQKVVA
jgi:glycosyltransferase involved in cell wall biosynthesis